MNKLWVVAIAFALTACGGTAVTREDVANANFGAKPTDAEAMRKIRSYLESVLIDPDSLRLKCSSVTDKAWAKDNMFNPPVFGYLVVCDVNSKNRLGGYTGAKEHVFLFNGSGFRAFDYSRYPSGGGGTHYGLAP